MVATFIDGASRQWDIVFDYVTVTRMTETLPADSFAGGFAPSLDDWRVLVRVLTAAVEDQAKARSVPGEDFGASLRYWDVLDDGRAAALAAYADCPDFHQWFAAAWERKRRATFGGTN